MRLDADDAAVRPPAGGAGVAASHDLGPAHTRPVTERPLPSAQPRAYRCWPGTELPLRGFVLLALLTLFWGVNWPIMKVGMSTIPVFTFRGITLAAGGLALLLLARLRGDSLAVPRHQWRMLLAVALFNITLWFVLAGYGLVFTESGRAAIIAYTMPVWSVLFATLILGESFTWRRGLSLALGMGAVAILLAGDLAAIGRAPVGPILMAAAALSWALGTVLLKKVAWQASTFVVLGWQVLLGGIPIFAGAAFVDPGGSQPWGLWPTLALLYNVFVPFLFCYYAYFEVIRLFPVGVATIGTLFIPVIGVFSGIWLLGERPGTQEYAALLLVVAALAVPVLTRARRPRFPAGPH